MNATEADKLYEVSYDDSVMASQLEEITRLLMEKNKADLRHRLGTNYRTGQQDPELDAYWELELPGLFLQMRRGEENYTLVGPSHDLPGFGSVRVVAWEGSWVKVRGGSFAVAERPEECAAQVLKFVQGLA